MSLAPTAMRRLMREIGEMQRSPPEGIRIQTDDDDMLDVMGIIKGPDGTPYAGGYFRVKFRFTDEFPAAPPKCTLLTKIFHPNVSSAGEICVNTLKKDWKSTYGISHILVTIKCLLIYPNPESALDEEAGKLLLENYESYCNRAKLITNIHATPRNPPPEFATPSKEEIESENQQQAGPSSSAPPTNPSTIDATPVVSIVSPPIARKTSATPVTAASPTLPLKSSSNLSPSSDKDAIPGKERHVSPSPLGTADSNIIATKKTMGTQSQNIAPPKKAVKRAATSSGAEKRKKALKRL